MSTDQPSPREEEIEDPSSDQEELSLDQLSQAYAQVMREHGQPFDEAIESESDANDSSGEELIEEESLTAAPKPQKSLDQIDSEDNSACSISPKSIVESILFVGVPAGVKMTGRKLAAVMRDVSPKEVKKIIIELNKEYKSANAAYRIVEESGDIKMKLTDDLVEVQNHYFGRNRPARLSQGAIDVLAIVAYNQPVGKSQVEKIRGKPSGGVLSQLLKRGLINVETETKSKGSQFGTTDRFLELFGLGALTDLPQTSIVSDLEELTDS